MITNEHWLYGGAIIIIAAVYQKISLALYLRGAP